MKRKNLQKMLSWMLSLSMIASYIPVSQGTEIPHTETTNSTLEEPSISQRTGIADPEVLYEVELESPPDFIQGTGQSSLSMSDSSNMSYDEFRQSFFAGVENDDKQTAIFGGSSSSLLDLSDESDHAFRGDLDTCDIYGCSIHSNGIPTDLDPSLESGQVAFQDSGIATYGVTPAYGFSSGEVNSLQFMFDAMASTSKKGTANLVAQGEHCNIWIMNPAGVDNFDWSVYSEFDLFSNEGSLVISENNATIRGTDADVVKLAENVDSIYKKMTQATPHAGVVVNTTSGYYPQVGDVDNDGKVNMLLYAFSSSFAGYFSSANYYNSENTPIDVVHMDVDAKDYINEQSFLGTFSHELQHLMYHTYMGVFNGSVEDSWINESLSGVPDMYYDNPAIPYDPNTANTSTQDFSITRLRNGTSISYTNGTEYGDFVNFNNGSKNYGMSYAFAAFMSEQEPEYFGRMYQQFKNNVAGKTYSDAVAFYANLSMEEMYGLAFQNVLKNKMPQVMNLAPEVVFEYVYTAFMESFISGGGDTILTNGTKVTTQEIMKAFGTTMWSTRNSNKSWSSITSYDNTHLYGWSNSGNAPYDTLSNRGTISMVGYPSNDSDISATHEMVYGLDTSGYNASTTNYLKIKVNHNTDSDKDSGFFRAYVALYDKTRSLTPNGSNELNDNYNINEDHADIYPLVIGEEMYIKVESTDILPHLFTLSFFQDVTSSVEYSWVGIPTKSDQVPLELQDGTLYNTLDLVSLTSGGSGDGAVTYALGDDATGLVTLTDGVLSLITGKTSGKFTVTAQKAGDELYNEGNAVTATITIAVDTEAPIISLSDGYEDEAYISLRLSDIANWKAITASAYDEVDGYLGMIEAVYSGDGTVTDLTSARAYLQGAMGRTVTITFTATDLANNSSASTITLESMADTSYLISTSVTNGSFEGPTVFSVWTNNAGTLSNEQLATLSTPTRSGYQFDFWSDVDGVEITDSYVFSENTTIYPQWEVYVPTGLKILKDGVEIEKLVIKVGDSIKITTEGVPENSNADVSWSYTSNFTTYVEWSWTSGMPLLKGIQATDKYNIYLYAKSKYDESVKTQITVEVVADYPPTLILGDDGEYSSGDTVSLKMTDASSWTGVSVTAQDEEDGDITNSIVTSYSSTDASIKDLETAKTYLSEASGRTVTVTYSITDSYSNTVTASLTIESVEGDPEITLTLGDESYSDTEDLEITNSSSDLDSLFLALAQTAAQAEDITKSDITTTYYKYTGTPLTRSDSDWEELTSETEAKTLLATAGSRVKVVYSTTSDIVATFYVSSIAEVFDITITPPVNGTVTVNPTEGAVGTEIEIIATPNSGYNVGKIIVTEDTDSSEVNVTDKKFSMPNSDVTVSVEFIDDIVVNSIEINSLPHKVAYTLADSSVAFEAEGLSIDTKNQAGTVISSGMDYNGTDFTLSATLSGNSVEFSSPYTFSAIGVYTITVTYGGCSTTFSVSVTLPLHQDCTCPEGTHDGITDWQVLTADLVDSYYGELPEGNYFLENNVQLNDYNIRVSGVPNYQTYVHDYNEVNLCLNGKTLTSKEFDEDDDYGSVISLKYADFTLYDNDKDEGKITGGVGKKLVFANISDIAWQGGGIYSYESLLTITGGQITGNGSTEGFSNWDGGGIYASSGDFTMTGGKVTGNKAFDGGGLCLYGDKGVPFQITGGEISGNTATGRGGGINDNTDSLTVSNVLITDNTANYGGGVYSYGEFTMEIGTEITNNTALIYGGGVSSLDGTFTMNDGRIQGNTAPYGGAIASYYNGSSLVNLSQYNLVGGTIIDNKLTDKSDANGAGIYLRDDDTLTLSGSVDLTDEVYLMEDAKITIESGFGVDYNKIPVSMEVPGEFTIGANSGDMSKFYSYDSTYYVKTVSGSKELELDSIVLDFDEQEYSSEDTVTVLTGQVEDLFTSLKNLADGSITVKYEIPTNAKSMDSFTWGTATEEDAKTYLNTVGNYVKVSYEIDSDCIALFYITTVATPTYAITVDTSDSNGNASVQIGDDVVTQAEEGKTIRIVASAKSNYQVDSVKVTKTASNTEISVTNNTFTMPKEAVTVTVTFKEKPLTITLDATTNGGSITPNTVQTGAEFKLSSLPVPDDRTGYTFLGWFTGPTTGGFITTETIFSTDYTIYARWTITEYTITLGSGTGGTVITPHLLTNDDWKITKEMLDTVDKTPEAGNQFKGWYTTETGNDLVDLNKVYDNNATIFAQWEVIPTYQVNLDLGGGSLSVSTWEINKATSATLLDYGDFEKLEPTRTGYTFLGWFDLASGGTKVDDQTEFHDDDTIYAQWEIITYTVTFHHNDVGSTITSEDVDYNNKVADPNPSNGGASFLGWYTESTFVNKFDITTEPITKDLELYGKWSESVTITVEFQNGEVSQELTTGENGKLGTNMPVDPTHSDLEASFIGWYDSTSGGNQVTADTIFSSDSTIYAQWYYNRTRVITLVSGEDGTIDKGSIETDDTGLLSYTSLMKIGINPKAGYYFVGWYTDDTFKTEVTADLSFGEDSKLYAQWAEIPTYYVNLDLGGGSLSVSTWEINQATSATLLDYSDFEKLEPTRTGYTFLGWFNLASGGTKVDAKTEFQDGDTIYAQWEEIPTYHVNLDIGGGSLSVSTWEINQATSATLLDYSDFEKLEPTRTGYTFLGWFNLASGGTKVDAQTEFHDGDTIYAQWEEIPTYHVNLDLGGGSLSVSTWEINQATSATLLDYSDFEKLEPTRTGYTFLGWFNLASGGTKVDAQTEFHDDDTIYAQWEEVLTYHVNLDLGGGSLSVSTWEINQATSATLLDYSDFEKLEPTRTGYSFLGWFNLASGGTKVDAQTEFHDDDTIYAQWEEVLTYHVNLDLGGGSLSVSTWEINQATSATLLNYSDFEKLEPTRTGYSFLGWFNLASGGTKVDAQTEFHDDDTIYAQWEEDESTDQATEYTITLETTTGGTLSKTTLTTDENGQLTETMLNSVVKTATNGYSFKGWFTTKEGSTEVSVSTVYTANTTIYAQWTKDPVESMIYDVVLISMSGGSLNKDYITTGADGRLTQATLDSVTKTPNSGYTFKGWYNSYYGNQAISLSTVYTNESFIYAFWEATPEEELVSTYTISIRSLTGGSIGSTFYLETNTNGTLSAADLLKITEELTGDTGYTFDAWYKSQTSNSKVTSSTVFTADTSIYARWIPDDYKVYFNNQGDVSATIVQHNSVVSPPADPVREGYIFLGWYNSGTQWYFSTKITGNITLTAKWERVETTIPPAYDFDGSGNIPGLDNAFTIRYSNKMVVMPFGSATALPAVPTAGNLVTITPEQGKIVEFVMVVTSLGEEIPVTRTMEGTYWFHQPSIAVTINVVYQEAFPFLDVGNKDYYYEAIHQLYTNGLLGYSTNYYPDIAVDRSTVVTMLYMLDGSPVTQFKQLYDDVHYTDSFGVPVTWAKDYAIFVGYEDGLFRPYTAITRQDLALVLSRYAEKEGVDVTSTYEYTNTYYDNYQISQYALESLNWALEKELLVESQSQTADPTGETSRGEYAVTMYEFQENILGLG